MEPEETLVDLAAPYALHALSDEEQVHLEAELARSAHADQFYAEVRAIREAMAETSAVTAAEPPASLRHRVLTAIAAEPPVLARRRRAPLLAAAAVAVGLAAVGIGIALRPAVAPSTEQQIFAAPDVRTVTGTLPAGGTATLVFSQDKHAGVLVMNNVPPPSEGTVYQMWLMNAKGDATSAGTMDAKAVAPSTTAVLPELGSSTELAFTVEPGGGSRQPTGTVFARLPLV